MASAEGVPRVVTAKGASEVYELIAQRSTLSGGKGENTGLLIISSWHL